MNTLSDHSLGWQTGTCVPANAPVALVIHGLNVKPTCMDPLVYELNRCGVATLRCALHGHGGNYLPLHAMPADEARMASFKQVTYPLWRDEAAAACRVAAQVAERRGVPLLLVAFSLGALLGCTAGLSCADIRFAKLVLFAPALRVHRRSNVLKWLERWPRLVVPSVTPPAYRANRGTPLAAYSALYAAQSDFERLIGPQLNIPTLAFVDPQDEMVSAGGLERLIVQRNLSHWQVHCVRKTAGAHTRYHHLLIDEPSVGTGAWRQMMARMRAHLAV